MTVKTKGRYQLVSPVHGTMNYHHIDHGGGKVVNARVDEAAAAPSTASITVADAALTDHGNILTIGDYDLIEGVHWVVVEGVVNDTAANLAASINNLSGFSAIVNGAAPAQVDITGPNGPHEVVFNQIAYNSNLTLSPDTGVMSMGDPEIVGPDIE